MARLIRHRALLVAAIIVALFVVFPLAANAQAPPAAQPGAPAAQPAWVGQTPVYQVGQNGAVNLDQPVMTYPMPYTAAQVPPGTAPPPMVMPQPAPTLAPPPGAPYGPYATPYATQPVAAPVIQQPFWGAPVIAGAETVPPYFVHRTSVFGEFLYMRPRDAEVAYAVPVAAFGPPPGGALVGPVAVDDPKYDMGFRVGANVALDKGSSIRGQYTRIHFNQDDSVTVAAPTVLLPLVVDPSTLAVLPPILDANASLEYDLDTFDLDYRGLLCGCECNCAYAVSYVVGAEYARLDQKFHSVFSTPGVTSVDTDIDFKGFGMRAGLEGERYFSPNGFFVYGHGITTLLFGQFDASYLQQNITTVPPTLQATTAWKAGRIVPVIEFELGAGWEGADRHLRLSAGYRVSAWFNMVKTADWIAAEQATDFRNMDGTLTFDGVVARAEWLF